MGSEPSLGRKTGDLADSLLLRFDRTAAGGDVALFRPAAEEKTEMLLLRPGRSVISRYSMKDQINEVLR